MPDRYVMVSPQVEIGTTDLSDRITSAELTLTRDTVESIASGDEYPQLHAAGIRRGSLTLGWIADYAAGEVWDTLRPLVGQTVQVKVTPAAGGDSFTADYVVIDLPQITGAVKELSTFTTTWPSDGDVTAAPAPPATPIWHTTLRVGAAGGDRGMDREAANMWGRLTDDDVVIGARTVTIWRLRVNGASGNVQLGTDHREDLNGKWLMVDGQVMEIDFGTATGNGQHTHTPGWSALTTGDLLSVSLWDRDPTGTSWAATTAPHKLWSTTMTVAEASNTSGYNAVTSQGSLDDAEISTPDGDQTLSRFRYGGGVLDVRMATAAEAALMFDLWFRFQAGDGTWVQTQISDIANTVLRLTPNPYTDDPAWLDAQAVTVEIWDQNPAN